MTKVWCIRANGGQYADHFVHGAYVGIGWKEIAHDLGGIQSRDDLYPIVHTAYPGVTSAIVIGNFVGQIARFLLEIQAGDYVITPAADTDWLHYGQVGNDPSYFFAAGNDGCPYRHRRPVAWADKRLKRGDFSVPFQNTIRSSLAVFAVSQNDEFFKAIGRKDLAVKPVVQTFDPYHLVIGQVLQLDPKEFEILIMHLLTALGFEGSEVTGKTGDGGVDVKGELDVSGLAKIRLFVQAKRYKPGSKISASVVKQLRAAIPSGGQGAFITTSDYQAAAAAIAIEPGFPRIGLINGNQLVDLLVEHWDDIPEEFRDKLGLKQGLVLA